ncbi:Phloem protein 2-like protein [Dioscorea alata]|uniref:Phloem protein 2-like protein n=1 Tax=Dioscorea alata TaxID=55571 RepID=A0ACB7VWD7_DIOAL|nr:Phloem protein 2-like protein [Dioscorea alata]
MASAHQIGMLAGNYTMWEAGGKQGLTLNTKAVNVIWGGEACKGRYWKKSLDGSTQVLELLAVYWLEVTGKIPLSLLSPNTKYKLLFNIKVTSDASGWNSPVILKVSLPGNKINPVYVNLYEYAGHGWVDIPEGLEFTVPSDDSGKLSFSMYENECDEWKKGLIIREVKFQPETAVRRII